MKKKKYWFGIIVTQDFFIEMKFRIIWKEYRHAGFDDSRYRSCS